jgi:hypothetical protein
MSDDSDKKRSELRHDCSAIKLSRSLSEQLNYSCFSMQIRHVNQFQLIREMKLCNRNAKSLEVARSFRSMSARAKPKWGYMLQMQL